jgi:hypothetical protein
MEAPNIIERYGGVVKEEPLSCIQNDLILKNTCVIEAVSPYFGYYNELKTSTKPQMVYFILDGYFSLEFLMRATVKIQQKVSFPIDAVTGSITMHNQTCNIIRFLNLKNYSHITMLQQMYIEEGLKFKKISKSFENEMGMIKLRRFFSLIPIGDGMFLEHCQPNIGFFVIPRNIVWEDFKKITTEVKYDTDLLYFDAARAFMYENRNITDMVRIYRENLTEEKLATIKNRYFKIIDSSTTLFSKDSYITPYSSQ